VEILGWLVITCTAITLSYTASLERKINKLTEIFEDDAPQDAD